MKKVSIKDIAQVVGVSIATVSIVLSGKNKNNRVSKVMSEKILKVAEEMHYRPNRLAKGLQSGRSQMIGLLVADIANPFFGTLAFHVQQEMQKKGYTVIIMNTDESPEQMAKTINLLDSRQVDGFIIIPAKDGECSINQLIDNNIPLVFIDRYYPSLNVQSVLIDNYTISYTAVQSLINQHCKRIGLLVYANGLSHMEERQMGYVDALKDSGLYDKNLIKRIQFKNLDQDVKEAINCLVKDEKIDGIFFVTNSIAITGIKMLMNYQLSIGDKLKIVCFDKNESYEFMPFDFQYISQPIDKMGALAAQLLIKQIEDDHSDNQMLYRLPAHLVSRF